jgi:protein TonB
VPASQWAHADAETTRQLLLRWTGATLCVATLHAGTAFAVINWPRPTLPSGEPPAAIMIELAPVPVAPEAPPQELAVGPQAVMSDQSTPSEEKQEQPQPEKSEPLPEPKPEAEKQPEPPPPTPVETPKLAEMANADAVLPLPAEKPPEEQPIAEKPPGPVKQPEKESSRPLPQAQKAAKATTAPKPMLAPKAKTNAAPSSGTASAASIASWRGAVVAHLNRHKRFPGGGSRGTSSVAFTIDRAGRVISARLIRSSGSSVLDQEAVSLARRASPVPAPPANITGRSIVLSVPIRFSR